MPAQYPIYNSLSLIICLVFKEVDRVWCTPVLRVVDIDLMVGNGKETGRRMRTIVWLIHFRIRSWGPPASAAVPPPPPDYSHFTLTARHCHFPSEDANLNHPTLPLGTLPIVQTCTDTELKVPREILIWLWVRSLLSNRNFTRQNMYYCSWERCREFDDCL